ncbi:MAG TPA: phosphoribosylaminoimidazolesuccinocarboxamide synthase [Candidatus Dormibacteraeota bacterium]|jgi:phosphoribosylaminoimidazole-succinocarboxamide synthase
MQVLSVADTADLNLYRRGKVRDTFQLDDGTLLMIATDRLSAFDVVLPTPILGKGTVLTQMSRWWFGQTAGMMPNHLLPDVEEAIPEVVRSDWLPRSMHVARAQRIDVECVVRGFISGSGWKEYRDKGTLAGESLQEGLRDSSRLPSPRFTPAIKKDDGHDVNISRQELRTLVGQTLADELESASLRLFDFATARCESVGIYLADTKFEFGYVNGTLTLIDEIFTPDSSRFWEISEWKEGEPAVSFDKQFVRDYVEKLGWDKTDPGPALPDDVVRGTTERYVEAARRICGIDLSETVAV